MPNLVIKRVGHDDVEELRQLSSQTFFDAFYHLNKSADMEAYAAANFTTEKFLAELRNPESQFYFAEIDGKVAGYIKLNRGAAQTEPRGDGKLEVERIYVSKNFQGQNIGGQLLDFALQKARDYQFDTLWLGVWEHNVNAIRFYERKGFAKFGSHPFMLGNDKQTDILMELKLY